MTIWFWIFGVPIIMILIALLLHWRSERNHRTITFDPPDERMRVDERTRRQITANRHRGTSHGWREAKS